MLKIRELREENRLTQQDMATKFGISRQVYANWENEINQPEIRMIIELADFFGVTVDYLIGRTDELGNIAAMPPAAPALAEDERRLLECYRALEPDYKRLAIDTLETWAGIPTKKGTTSRA